MLLNAQNKIKKLKVFNRIDRLPVTLKVTIWYTMFLFIILSLFVISFFLVSGSYAASLSEQELQKIAQKMATEEKKYELYEDGFLFLLYDGQGNLINGKTPTAFNVEVNFKEDAIREFWNNESHFIYLDAQIKRGENQGDWIRGVASMNALDKRVFLISIALLIVSPIILIAIALGGYRIIKYAFKPVKKISQTAIEIGSNYDLSKRISIGQGHDEIYQMGHAFNEMLASLEKASIHEKQFTSDVSHELRTPISVILAESQYGELHADSKEEADKGFQVITRQSKRMKRLINELLEISRMDRTNEIEKINFNLSELLRIMILDYRNLTESLDVVLEDHIEEDVYINGNKMMIQRVFDNLFNNALKFTSTKIIISLKDLDGKIDLSVKDNGSGISKENQARIWERFYQVGHSRNKTLNEGFGLGLAMVKRIMELHQGEVNLESEEGIGSTFIVTFRGKMLDDESE